jgi:hypothetical protein
MKVIPPSIKETAFNCPHCYALAQQYWFTAHAYPLKENDRPRLVDTAEIREIILNKSLDNETRDALVAWTQKSAMGIPFLWSQGGQHSYTVQNVWYSRCYHCNEIAVWIFDKLMYPRRGEAPPANPDMPADIRRDYDEAGTILDLSPRGAAALIRLAIQKLCKELGQPGRKINDDIGSLVKGGLDPRIQQALDIVRVVGNSAVHPGQIDLRDDRATAETLFKLLNLIVDKTISITQPDVWKFGCGAIKPPGCSS